MSRYQKGKTNLNFAEAKDSEWQWHQLGRMQVCISLQTDNHASTSPLSFLKAGCPFCRPTNSVKALKARTDRHAHHNTPLPYGGGVINSHPECIDGVCWCSNGAGRSTISHRARCPHHGLVRRRLHATAAARLLSTRLHLVSAGRLRNVILLSARHHVRIYTHTRLTTLFRDDPGEPVPQR